MEQDAVIRELQVELMRVTEDRDRWRKAADALYLCGKCDWCREQYEKAVGDAGRSNP